MELIKEIWYSVCLTSHLFNVGHFNALKIFIGYFQQSVTWPFAEPVDRGAVYERRVHTDTVPGKKRVWV